METTIPSYLTSRPSRDLIVAGHQQLTRDWWDRRRKDFDIFISQFVIDEAGLGDPVLSQRRLKLISSLDQLEINDTVGELTNKIRALSAPLFVLRKN